MASNDISIAENVKECMLKYPEYSERFFAMLPALGKKAVLEWCMKEGLIGSSYACPKCGKSMKLRERKGKKAINDGFEWYCRNQSIVKEERHDVCRSVRNGSWFGLSHLDMCTVLLVMRKWFGRCPQKYAIEDLNVSNHTVIDWYNFCREICIHVLVRDSCKIGGVGKIVEVGESKFGIMKYGRGRPVKGRWVFGGIDSDMNKCFFRVVSNRTSACLLEVITEWVLPGTTIISDCWDAYECLEDEGFQRLEANHSLTFVYPETGAHSNIIEGPWGGIKRFLGNSANRTEEMFDSKLHEFMWRKINSHSVKNEIFKKFLADIADIYPPTLRDPTPEEEFFHITDDDDQEPLDVDVPGPSSASA